MTSYFVLELNPGEYYEPHYIATKIKYRDANEGTIRSYHYTTVKTAAWKSKRKRTARLIWHELVDHNEMLKDALVIVETDI